MGSLTQSAITLVLAVGALIGGCIGAWGVVTTATAACIGWPRRCRALEAAGHSPDELLAAVRSGRDATELDDWITPELYDAGARQASALPRVIIYGVQVLAAVALLAIVRHVGGWPHYYLLPGLPEVGI